MSDSGSLRLGAHSDARCAIPTNRCALPCETNSEGRLDGPMSFMYPYCSSRPIIPKNQTNFRQRGEEDWTSKRLENGLHYGKRGAACLLFDCRLVCRTLIVPTEWQRRIRRLPG
jgi:hypothetical protein